MKFEPSDSLAKMEIDVMKYILFVVLLLAVSGCAALSGLTDKGADKVAKGVIEYCANTDAAFRAQFRADINAKAAGNTIAVECAK